MRSKTGYLLWLANQTRPDLSFGVSSLAVKLKDATVGDVLYLNKLIRRAKSTCVNLKFCNIGNVQKIVSYTDAAFGNLHDGGSQGSYLVFLVGDGQKCNLLSWQSKRLKRVVRSTLSAESLAMSECIDGTVFIASLFIEIMFGNKKHLSKTSCHNA